MIVTTVSPQKTLFSLESPKLNFGHLFVEILNFEGPFKFRIIFAKLETNKGPLGLVSMATMLRIHANVDAFLNGSSDILGKKEFLPDSCSIFNKSCKDYHLS